MSPGQTTAQCHGLSGSCWALVLVLTRRWFQSCPLGRWAWSGSQDHFRCDLEMYMHMNVYMKLYMNLCMSLYMKLYLYMNLYMYIFARETRTSVYKQK